MSDDQFERLLVTLAGNGNKNKLEGWRILTPILLCLATIANAWVIMAVMQSRDSQAAFKTEFTQFKDSMNNRMAGMEGLLKGMMYYKKEIIP